MIVKTTRYLMIFITILVASIYLPNMYWKIFDINVRIPMILYSPVINQFLIFRPAETVKYTDQVGNKYTRDKFESLEPIFYYRQLVATEKMPDSLRGIKLDLSLLRLNNFRIKITPPNLTLPQIKLFPMLESKSGRASLEMPSDVFRITNKRIEFIDCTSNTIDEEKSDLFTTALIKEEFSFPAKFIYGNPTTRKAFDEGYFVVDNADQIFHIKMVKGRPFCKNIRASESIKVKSMMIAESSLKEFYGIILTENDEIFMITYKNYKLKKLPITGYNSSNTTLVFRGDIFFRYAILTNSDSLKVFMLTKNYKVFDTYYEPIQNVKKMGIGTAATYIFPFRIGLGNQYSYLINLDFECSGFSFLILNIFLVLISMGLYIKRGLSLKKGILDFIIVLVTGIYGIIAINIFIPFDKTK
ncbi:MAG: DUF4857 domain-containing protein [bacterium]